MLSRFSLWNDDAAVLPGAADWQPVSLRIVEHNVDLFAYIEVRNVTGEFAHAPDLQVEVFDNGDSLGVVRIQPDLPWVGSGASTFYQVADFFEGEIGLDDWDDLTLGVIETSSMPDDGRIRQGVRIEEDRVHNDLSMDLPRVALRTVVRDSDGIFSGSCYGPTTLDELPGGQSVSLSTPADPETTPECEFATIGMDASDDVGIGGPFTSEYYVLDF